MHFSLQTVAVLFGLLSPIVARPYTQDELVARTMAENLGKLQWVGEVTPGQGNITLWGNDIHDVIDQIKVINPNYTSAENQAIRARSSSQAADEYDNMKTMYCGIFATADAYNVETIAYEMTVARGVCFTPALMCIRWGCLNTSGVYVCNDDDIVRPLPCDGIALWATAIEDQCCSRNHVDSPYLSGQVFHKFQNFNVVVAYGNCNHKTNADRPSIFKYPGVNGECCQVCRRDKNGNPGPGGWGHDGL